MSSTSRIAIIDVSPLVTRSDDQDATATAIRKACTTQRFFYVVGHGVSEAFQERLEALSHRFFALDENTKLTIRMELEIGRAHV